MNAHRRSFIGYLKREWLVCLAENRFRLADQIPFYISFDYSVIEDFSPGLEFDLLKLFTELREIIVSSPVKDIERFLNILFQLKYLIHLDLYWSIES